MLGKCNRACVVHLFYRSVSLAHALWHTVVTVHLPHSDLQNVFGVDITLDDLVLIVPYHVKFLLSLAIFLVMVTFVFLSLCWDDPLFYPFAITVHFLSWFSCYFRSYLQVWNKLHRLLYDSPQVVWETAHFLTAPRPKWPNGCLEWECQLVSGSGGWQLKVPSSLLCVLCAV